MQSSCTQEEARQKKQSRESVGGWMWTPDTDLYQFAGEIKKKNILQPNASFLEAETQKTLRVRAYDMFSVPHKIRLYL